MMHRVGYAATVPAVGATAVGARRGRRRRLSGTPSTRRSSRDAVGETATSGDDDDDERKKNEEEESESVNAAFLRAIVARGESALETLSGTARGDDASASDGLDALATRLGSSCASGLENESSRVEMNRATYGANATRAREMKTTLDFAREALEDPTLRVLVASGAASLLLETSLVASRGGDATNEPAWLNGAAILLAVCVVVVVECVNNEEKQRAFTDLNAASEETSLASVTRGGKQTLVSRRDVVVGDIVDLQAGDVSPADALVCKSADLLVDQSHITGESDDARKRRGDVVFGGSRITSGRGSALCVAVGETSSCGEIAEMIGVGGDEDATPLQRRLRKLAFDIGKYGVAAAASVGTILAWKTTVDAMSGTITPVETTVAYLNNVIVAITIIVVSVPEVSRLFIFLSFGSRLVERRSVMIGVLKSLRENSLTTQTHVFADFLLTNADAHESFSRFLLFFIVRVRGSKSFVSMTI